MCEYKKRKLIAIEHFLRVYYEEWKSSHMGGILSEPLHGLFSTKYIAFIFGIETIFISAAIRVCELLALDLVLIEEPELSISFAFAIVWLRVANGCKRQKVNANVIRNLFISGTFIDFFKMPLSCFKLIVIILNIIVVLAQNQVGQ